MGSSSVRLLLALPVVAAVAAVVLAMTEPGGAPDPAEDETVVNHAPARSDTAATPRLAATKGPPRSLLASKAPQPKTPEIDPALLRAFARAKALHEKGMSQEALRVLAPWLRTHKAWFEDAARREFLLALRTRVAEVQREQIETADHQLDKWIDIAARWGTLREDPDATPFEARVRASAEIIGGFKNPKARAAVTRHVRRFVVGVPGGASPQRTRSGRPVPVDNLLEQVATQTGNDPSQDEPETLPEPDPEASEARRLEELERLRNAGALDVLDSIAASLAWLALHQSPEGTFGDDVASDIIKAKAEEEGSTANVSGLRSNAKRYRLATTALCTLAFLDFRDQDLRGLFEPTLAKAITWLLAQQKEDGSFKSPGRSFYAEAIALMALGQAAAATKREDLQQAVVRGLTWLYARRGPRGGYRYTHGQAGDLSAAAWVAQAAETAQWAQVELPTGMKDDLTAFVRDTWIRGADYRYVVGGSRRTALSPVGMLAQTILSPDDADEALREVWKKALTTQWKSSRLSLYSRYYAVRMMAKLHEGMPNDVASALLTMARTQEASGPLAGAFSRFPGVRYMRMTGATGVTAMVTLMFEHALYDR